MNASVTSSTGSGSTSKRSGRFPSPIRRSDPRPLPPRRLDHSRRESITDREIRPIKYRGPSHKVATGDCMGVDGVAVIINGVIVNELDDARAFTTTQFDAKFFFSQVKTSSSLDTGDVLKFLAVVRAFFGRDISVVPPELHGAFEIKSLIYSRAAKMRQAPTVELAYVYSGRYEPNGSHASTQIEVEVNGLKAMPYLFSDVTCRVCDGEAMARLYRETQNDIQKEISFQRHVALPPIQGARAAYLGVVSCKDYVKMIEKDNRDLNKGIFFDNVRDYLGGSNPVNQEIAKTINDPDERNQFAILNNGVTIVAKNVIPSGDNFKISRFQVVNGCQTSNVLFSNRGLPALVWVTFDHFLIN